MPTCDILLASYNATQFGPALLESLLAQTSQEFGLLVRDDGSGDGSLDLLRSYEERFGGRMRILEGGAPTGSALGNFSILMHETEADYVMFADIDDVWLPGKVAHTLDLLRRTEAAAAPGAPVYVFTDVTPVNAELEPITQSYWAFKKIDPAVGRSLRRSLVCPVMLGCASGVNRALLRLANPVPATVTGHDWWGQLVAAAFGEVAFSSEQTMLYRLHGSNQSNQKRVGFRDYLRGRNKVAAVRHGMMRRREQAQALIDHFGDRLPVDRRQLISEFVATGSQGPIRRRLTILRGGYLYADAPRNVAMLLGM
jgi:glycosyltransferase involved in cell wall biosynthesis